MRWFLTRISGGEPAGPPSRQWVERACAEDEGAEEQEYYEHEQVFFVHHNVGVEQAVEASGHVSVESSEIVRGFKPRDRVSCRRTLHY